MAQFSAPVSPMKNIYLPQLLQLVQIKLRVGHAISRNTAKYIRSGWVMYYPDRETAQQRDVFLKEMNQIFDNLWKHEMPYFMFIYFMNCAS